MSPRSPRKAVLLGLTAAALAAGAYAAFAQGTPAGPPIPLTPPDGIPLGSTPAVSPAGPVPDDEIPLPFLGEPPAVPASQVTAPAAAPAPVTSARRVPEPPVLQPLQPDVPGVRPRDVVPEPRGVDAAPSPLSAFAFVDDPELRRDVERMQRDALRYSLLLDVVQKKSQICALEEAPAVLCGARRHREILDEDAGRAFTMPDRAVEPPPLPDRAPYAVVTVAGSGSDVVVTLVNPDTQSTHTLRPGGWIDPDYKVVAADFETVTIRGRGRTWRLPVSSGATWGTRS